MAVPLTYIEMVNLANYHCHKYYVENDSEISDEEYDVLYRKILDYEKEHPKEILAHSPTQRVGSPITSEDISKVTRKIKMGSLGNVFNQEEFTKNFIDKLMGYETLAIELKFDGAGLELDYVYGELVAAVTRGDGLTGELVTHSAKAIKSIPIYIPELTHVKKIQIRGEVIMPYESALRYKENNPDKKTISPRNIASGSLRLLDPKVVAERGLLFIPHSLGEVSGEIKISTFKEFNSLCRTCGFRTVTTQEVDNPSKVQDIYNQFVEYRSKLPFAADGLVVKVNKFERHELYGETAKEPKWAVAWKFPSEEKEVVLQDVIWQVGRTGVLTPVAIFDEVELSDVMVTNATLHNFDDIKRKDIHIGDTIVVTRSGDVIPKVLRVNPEKRHEAVAIVIPPNFCPSCGAVVIQKKASIVCPSITCQAKAIQRFTHFASRNAMNITGLGEAMAEEAYTEMGVRTLHELITFDYLERGKETGKKKLYKNLQDSINKALENVDPSKLLFAFGIHGVGEVQAEEIVSYLNTVGNTLKDLFTDTFLQDQLETIPGIGHITAKTFKKFMEDADFVSDLMGVLSEVKSFKEAAAEPCGDAFDGKTFVITGTLSKPRKEIEAFIKQHKGKVSGSVSKKTSYLVVGENPGQDKTSAASRNGVEVITEEELYFLAL